MMMIAMIKMKMMITLLIIIIVLIVKIIKNKSDKTNDKDVNKTKRANLHQETAFEIFKKKTRKKVIELIYWSDFD